ncbi:hypothetical protein SDC9_179173 [bioreactor metagenome]|uniref:Apea-like HEPN domain-containing protein n=1 Tax=bioreactor metagenome TaxID=1076179 RepID=A0A645H140_9ZZZZ
MIDKDFVFSRIGMALISAQRVEFITNQLVSHLRVFDKDIYGITGEQFLAESQKANFARITLGNIFKLLKLNSNLVIEDELNEYLDKRNTLVHSFWRNYLVTISEEQTKKAIDFCYDFGKQSERIESFFKGFIFFLALRHVEDITKISDELKIWKEDFNYFLTTIREKRLKEKVL